jgi:hypothetical protein
LLWTSAGWHGRLAGHPSAQPHTCYGQARPSSPGWLIVSPDLLCMIDETRLKRRVCSPPQSAPVDPRSCFLGVAHRLHDLPRSDAGVANRISSKGHRALPPQPSRLQRLLRLLPKKPRSVLPRRLGLKLVHTVSVSSKVRRGHAAGPVALVMALTSRPASSWWRQLSSIRGSAEAIRMGSLPHLWTWRSNKEEELMAETKKS